MYVPQSNACSVQNSSTPVSPADLAASIRKYADVTTVVNTAQAAFDSLLNRPDLNRGGFPLIDFGGIPSLPFSGFKKWPYRTSKSSPCIVSAPLPKPVAVDLPVGFVLPPPPPIPSMAADRIKTTGNVCIDLQKGYALQSQVSPAMLWACSKAGYSRMGLKPTALAVSQLAAENRLAHIPDQDVADYDPKTMGLAGVNDGIGGFAFWGSLGLAAATIWLGHEYSKGKKR